MFPKRTCLVLTWLIVLDGNAFASAYNNSTNGICANKTGPCIPVHDCKPIMSILLSKIPLTDEVIRALRDLNCGFQGRTPKVCCPSEAADLFKLTNSSSIIKNSWKAELLPTLESCGLYILNRFHSYTSTERAEYPWNALLGHKTGNVTKFYCGGALISSRYVLTAAHCICRSDNYELSSVRLGEYDTTTNPDCGSFSCTDELTDIPIEKAIVHEKYNPNDPNRHFNIALIRLAQNVTFTEFVSPVCLPPLSQLDKDEKLSENQLFISGWGFGADRQEIESKYQIYLNLKDVNECTLAPRCINTNFNLNNNQLCAKSSPDHNLCYADDGAVVTSILSMYSKYGNHFAVGISSFAMDRCCNDTHYIIFTKLKDYVPWIYDKLEL